VHIYINTCIYIGYYLPDKTAVCVNACPSVANYKKFICDYDLQEEVDKDATGGFYHICICIYVYIYIHECMYVCMYAYVFTYINIHVWI
jgi:hypothetical protein